MNDVTKMALQAILTDLITGGTVKDALEEIDNLLLFPEKSLKKMDKQLTFAPEDIEEFKPLLKEISEGKARGFIIAAEFKDGISMKTKSRPSKKLINELKKYLEV